MLKRQKISTLFLLHTTAPFLCVLFAFQRDHSLFGPVVGLTTVAATQSEQNAVDERSVDERPVTEQQTSPPSYPDLIFSVTSRWRAARYFARWPVLPMRVRENFNSDLALASERIFFLAPIFGGAIRDGSLAPPLRMTKPQLLPKIMQCVSTLHCSVSPT